MQLVFLFFCKLFNHLIPIWCFLCAFSSLVPGFVIVHVRCGGGRVLNVWGVHGAYSWCGLYFFRSFEGHSDDWISRDASCLGSFTIMT